MAMLFPDPFDALYQFQQAVEALHASDWLERSLSGGGAYSRCGVNRDQTQALDATPDDLPKRFLGIVGCVRIAG